MDVSIQPRTPTHGLGRNDTHAAVGHGRITSTFGLRHKGGDYRKTPTEFARKQGVIISFLAITDLKKEAFSTINQWATSSSARTL